MRSGSQNDLILKALKRGRKLTALDALAEFGCLRLAARIDDLKRLGFKIKSTPVESSNGKRFASYYIPRKRK